MPEAANPAGVGWPPYFPEPDGTILIEPKPHEPAKHMYDRDAATLEEKVAMMSGQGFFDSMKRTGMRWGVSSIVRTGASGWIKGVKLALLTARSPSTDSATSFVRCKATFGDYHRQMTETTLTPQRRFSPEIRRSMILDAAADMVEREGISRISMERIAKHANISKSLIYKYFDNATELLQELLKRELKDLRRAQFAAAEDAETFEELVRGITKAYLQNIAEKGLLIEKLQSDPAISESKDPTRFGRESAVNYLADIVHQNFSIPLSTARMVTDISFGVPSAAGSYLLRHPTDMEELEDITVSMIIGTVNGVRNDYMVRKRKLKRSQLVETKKTRPT